MTDATEVPEFGATSFALPEPVLKAHEEAFARAGVSWQPRMATVDSYRVPVGLFSAPDDRTIMEVFVKVFEVLGSVPFDTFAPCRVRGRKTRLYNGVIGSVATVPFARDGKRPSTTAYKTYEAILAQFSRITGGLNIELHEELDRPAQRAPWPDTLDLVRVMTYAVPPGELGEIRITEAFETPIDHEARAVRVCVPVPGRGVVGRDEEHALVQVLGNTWYILVPMVDIFNEVTSSGIFTELVALAWSTYRTQKVDTRRRQMATRKEFCQTATAVAGKLKESLDLALTTHDLAIERLRQDVARLQSDRRRFTIMRDALANGPGAEETQAGLQAQWRRLKRHPHIERLDLVDDGLQVTTKAVVIESAEKRYPLGRFVIRIGHEGVISAWNLDILHPDGVPHPHIMKNGGPCFGNAAEAIEQAASQFRYADAIEYALRWLLEGYHPALAVAKLEEWPSEPVAQTLEEAS